MVEMGLKFSLGFQIRGLEFWLRVMIGAIDLNEEPT